MPRQYTIVNTPRDYAWGVPGGVSAALGWPETDAVEAELWLGAHPGSPSRFTGDTPWGDLAEWERSTGGVVPFLLKVLAARSPLSLQAHPTPAQARLGFEAENRARIALDAPSRNYKDPHAKPELIVALADGFQALCGFRPVAESVEFIDRAEARASDPTLFLHWRRLLGESNGLEASVAWLLSGGPAVALLVAELERQARELPEELRLVSRLAELYPGDPGIAVAQLLNHVTLSAWECLWLPAGNIHAYLCGVGVELMGPSDNVLRGGLTPKHVDVDELVRVLDFTPMPPPRLFSRKLAPNLVAYQPPLEEAGFTLLMATGDAKVATGSPSILVVLDGEFEVGDDDESTTLRRGESLFVPGPENLRLVGSGRVMLATAGAAA